MKRLMTLILTLCIGFHLFAQARHDLGIQLYTLRTMIGSAQLYEQNHDQVFDALAEYGFTQAELYGYDFNVNSKAAHEPSDLVHQTLDTYFTLNNAIIVWNLSQAKELAKSKK